MKTIHSLALALILAATFPGCTEKPVVMVEGIQITEHDVDRAMKQQSLEHKGQGANVDMKNMRGAIIEQLIDENLLMIGAKAAGVTIPDDELAERIRDIKRRAGGRRFDQTLKDQGITEEQYTALLRDRMTKERFADSLVAEGSITEEQLKDFYKNSPMPFLKDETVEVRFIQAPTYDMAVAAKKRIEKAKGNFDKVAEELDKPGNYIVSKYGWTSTSMYTGEILDGLKSLKPGKYGGPYAGKEGYYLIALKSREPERPRTFEEARQEIEGILFNQLRNAAVSHWLAARRDSSKIIRN